MSKVDVEYGLEEIITSKGNIFVLFYASWCPFSQRFLKVFDSFSQDRNRKCARVVVDDKASLCEKYSVDVVPTVLLFEKGRVKKRLDGVPGEGLTEKQLANFAKSH
jgi:thioredoxin-like negative regulator of GroEL